MNDPAVLEQEAPAAQPGRAGGDERVRPVVAFVRSQVERLQRGYLDQGSGASASRAELAALRRGLGKPLGEILELVDLVAGVEVTRPHSDAPTRKEKAAYAALTLYALHQQSQGSRMHVRGRGFGEALAGLRYIGGDENEGVVRRFQALGTATSLDEVVHHARGLVTLLRSAERGLDYGLFADDLYKLQQPGRASAVRLSWGRDFYRVATPSDEAVQPPEARQSLADAQGPATSTSTEEQQ